MNLDKIKTLLTDERIKKAFKEMKPKRSIWGFLSVVLLFIFPEIIAFIYGDDIARYCDLKLSHNLPYAKQYLYENLKDLMSEGSWINLSIGFAFLIWLFF